MRGKTKWCVVAQWRKKPQTRKIVEKREEALKIIDTWKRMPQNFRPVATQCGPIRCI